MKPTVLVGTIILGVFILGIVSVWRFRRDRIPEGLTIVSGRIEGDPVVVAAKVSGRLISLAVKEGDAVEVGQPIAELSAEQIIAKVDQAAAARDSTRSTLDAAQAAAASARNQLGRAEAARAAAAARREKAAKDARRAEQLFAEHVIPQAKLDEIHAAREVTNADLRAAEEQVEAARRAIAAADAQVASAAQQVQGTRAALDESRATFGDTQVQSPTRGVVTTKVTEQGEVLAAGAPIVVIVDLDTLHMKAYVPEPEIGRIKIGDSARVYVDAFPERPFPARVGEIASQSEFTPKEVQTRQERVKQVIAVKLFLDANPDHILVPGMPADAVIRWKAEAPWINPINR